MCLHCIYLPGWKEVSGEHTAEGPAEDGQTVPPCSVHIAPVAHFRDDHDKPVMLDSVYHSVIAYAETVKTLETAQLLYAWGVGI